MGEINQFVTVQITRQAASLARQGFGNPLFIAVFPAKGPYATVLTQTYTSLNSVKLVFTDDITVTAKIYCPEVIAAATTIFSQSIVPTYIVIGRRSLTTSNVADVTFPAVVIAGDKYTVNINRKLYTSLGTETTGTLVAATILGLITADTTNAVSAVATGAVLTVTSDATYSMLIDCSNTGLSAAATIVAGTGNVQPQGIVAAFDDIYAENRTWYGVLLGKQQFASAIDVDIIALASEVKALASTSPMLFVCVSASADNLDPVSITGTDVGNVLYTARYDKTAWMYSPYLFQYADAAWMALQLPKPPGSSTWKFKQLVGITPVTLSDSERIILEGIRTSDTYTAGKNGNFIELVAGLNITASNAVVCSGEYIDIIHGVDALTVRSAEGLFGLLVGSEKVPMTNQGIGAVGNVLQNVWVTFATNENPLLVKTSIAIELPDISAVPIVDRTLRLLQNVHPSATLQGAIQQMFITGNVSV